MGDEDLEQTIIDAAGGPADRHGAEFRLSFVRATQCRPPCAERVP